jgi:hypothetical protein
MRIIETYYQEYDRKIGRKNERAKTVVKLFKRGFEIN